MMLTGYADIGSLVRAINEGRIYRYISKPWEPDEVRLNVKRALEAYALASENVQLAAALSEANERLRAENLYLRREVERRYAFDQILGDSPQMQQVFEVMEKVAETDATSWPAPSTTRARGAASDSWRRTARRCRTRCSRASSSATSAGSSPAPMRTRRACSRSPIGARSSSTRSVKPSPACRCGCCACSRTARSGPWAPRAPGRSTCA